MLRTTALQGNPIVRELRKMRFGFVGAGTVCRTSTILHVLLWLALALDVGCAGKQAEQTPPKLVDLTVTGQTVTKARSAGNQVVFMQERLTSIFEEGPRRTLAILKSDGVTVQPYVPPPG